MATLISVNVGMPKAVAWRDQSVFTGVYKSPVGGPVMVRHLNIDGDGQGDLNGHGGENRAVLVYQTESYDYWRSFLGRSDLEPGAFGENFTVSGLPDDSVCIGDRFRIGGAEFEVTQPRVTCFRVGMRLGIPDMPRLLVAHHRSGFYLRVITEGHVCAGDPIVQTGRGRHQLTVAAVDALLYLPDPDPARLRQAVDVPALSPGWVQSFKEMLSKPSDAALEPAWRGFRCLRIISVHRESSDVVSIQLGADEPLPIPLPGQYLTLRVNAAGSPAALRSYSLSGDPADGIYRISVKRESGGRVSQWLHDNAETAGTLEAAAPRGEFTLDAEASSPVVLLSAGIGATPVLAMLHWLSGNVSDRRIIWIHATHDRDSHVFAEETDALIQALPHAEQYTVYSAREGRLDRARLASIDIPVNAHVYVCGPTAFMDAVHTALVDLGVAEDHIHTEQFGARPPINPGVQHPRTVIRPHQPAITGSGPAVTFARSALTVPWSSEYRSLLELSEACDVPTRFSCRSGVCHVCITAIVDGEVDYVAAPLEPPEQGSALVCCSIPSTDLVLDL
ncbi:sulfurase [Mycolicibacterium agri]|uniref:Sulfurase n=1 Tax=Mycolicibacterium agri TaxID=36811 RepID=A0A2A7N733_MYCAG|nr:MOSC and FAD-binding oxidoreductase domain-containing protein [Mycolicibacterium agri]PEG39537.1 sulfurase [Mycolicibacterium agri]GFG48625.1 sulfurase [Mycolicibacterium agri]